MVALGMQGRRTRPYAHANGSIRYAEPAKQAGARQWNGRLAGYSWAIHLEARAGGYVVPPASDAPCTLGLKILLLVGRGPAGAW